jgi:PAS domain S-box-containing protein
MLGYSRDEYIGRHIGEFYDDRSVIDDMLARLARGETLRDWPARMRCKDGSLRDVLVSSNALFEGGELVHTRCFTRDVTDARRAQLAQARLAAIVEASDDAIVSKTLEGSILSWNSGAERLFGYSASEAIGRPINLIIPPELQDEERSILQRLRRGERIDHFETVRVSKDGRRFEISLTVSPVRDSAGTVIGASKVARDVSERKRAEARLRESESDARLLQRLSAELIQQDDDRAIYLKIVDAAAEVMRSQFASVQALVVDERGDEVLDLLAARGFSAEAEKFWRRVRFDSKSTCAIAFRQRKRVVVRDVRESALIAGSADFGMYVRAGIRSVQSTPLVTRSGRLVGMISTHWSEPHEPGERDLQNFDILARQATDLLERARAEVALKEADRRKDEFLATLAHELRNPLSPVRHSLEIMKHGPADPEVVEQALRTMDRQVAQMERLIDDLLDIARITNNRLELRKQTIPLASVVQDAVDAVRPLAQSLRHEIEVSLPPHPIEISGDPARLAQVFGNLLNNACKYTPAGGRIVLDARRRGRDAVVSIKDNGIGIPRDKMTHIFEIFSQLDKSLERAQGGLGIGLSLSKQLVEMHGGTIEAHSEGLGKGSEFVVRLPIESPAEPADSPSPAEKRAASSALRRVLVVDDNRDGAESLAKLLSLSGHETRIAFDGVEAIAAAEEFRPHVILLDIGMPRMNGFEACRRIREQPWGSDVAMIALTGWGQEEDRRKSRDSGFDGHLVKPVNHAALMTLVTSLTGKQDL